MTNEARSCEKRRRAARTPGRWRAYGSDGPPPGFGVRAALRRFRARETPEARNHFQVAWHVKSFFPIHFDLPASSPGPHRFAHAATKDTVASRSDTSIERRWQLLRNRRDIPARASLQRR